MPGGGLLDAHDVAFRILNFDEPAHRGNFAFRHDDLAAIRDNGRPRRVDVRDPKGALIAVHALARHDFVAFLQSSLDSWLFFVAGGDQEETWRSPRLKLPTERFFIEALRPRQVIGMNSKENKVARHVEFLR